MDLGVVEAGILLLTDSFYQCPWIIHALGHALREVGIAGEDDQGHDRLFLHAALFCEEFAVAKVLTQRVLKAEALAAQSLGPLRFLRLSKDLPLVVLGLDHEDPTSRQYDVVDLCRLAINHEGEVVEDLMAWTQLLEQMANDEFSDFAFALRRFEISNGKLCR